MLPIFLLLARAAFGAEPEEELAVLWQRHQKAPGDHAARVEDCRAFHRAFPSRPVTAVARGLEAWHLLKDGHIQEAIRALQALAAGGGDPATRAGSTMGNRWLARIDRDRIKNALRKAYARDICYPDSLDTLAQTPGVPAFPRTDPWGKPWTYRLEPFRRLNGLTAQRYVLESPALGMDSDLADALAVPYATRIALRPVRLVPGTGARQPILFETAAPPVRQALLSEGRSFEDVTFAYDGDLLIVLSDGDHWLVLRKPRPDTGR